MNLSESEVRRKFLKGSSANLAFLGLFVLYYGLLLAKLSVVS